MLAVGAKGVISVASNVIPEAMVDLVQLALNGNWETARELHAKYYRLFSDLFIDTNPIPVKACLAMMGCIEEVYRLPLCPLSTGHKQVLRTTAIAAGILRE
jgi:4-hydroxy-tetrahydrodipicolinate synthase